MRPVKGQILELRARGAVDEPFTRVLRTPRCYLVGRGDGRVVLGATMEEQAMPRSPPMESSGCSRRPTRCSRTWASSRLVGARARLRQRHARQHAGDRPRRGSRRTVWATGHWRNGVLLAPLTGESVAALLAGEELPAELSALSPDRFGAGARMTLVMLNGERQEAPGQGDRRGGRDRDRCAGRRPRCGRRTRRRGRAARSWSTTPFARASRSRCCTPCREGPDVHDRRP